MISVRTSTHSETVDQQPRCLFEEGVPVQVRDTALNLLDQWRFLPGEHGIRLSILPGGANNINLILEHGDKNGP